MELPPAGQRSRSQVTDLLRSTVRTRLPCAFLTASDGQTGPCGSGTPSGCTADRSAQQVWDCAGDACEIRVGASVEEHDDDDRRHLEAPVARDHAHKQRVSILTVLTSSQEDILVGSRARRAREGIKRHLVNDREGVVQELRRWDCRCSRPSPKAPRGIGTVGAPRHVKADSGRVVDGRQISLEAAHGPDNDNALAPCMLHPR